MATWNDLGILNSVSYTVTTGVMPSTTYITIPSNKKIDSSARDLIIGDATIKNLYPLREQSKNASLKVVTLVDSRYFWNFPKIYWTKNMLVARGYIFYPSQFSANSIRQPVWREKTVKLEKNELSMYTSKELLEELFLFFPDISYEFDFEFEDEAETNQRPALNFVKFGESFANILQQLLDLTQMQIQPLNDGSFRIYRQYDGIAKAEGYFNKIKKLNSGGIVERITQLQKPKRVIVKVPKVQEILLSYAKQGDTLSSDEYDFTNVTTLNYDLRDSDGNIYYRGMEYDISEIVAIIGSGNFRIGTVSVSTDGVPTLKNSDTVVGKKTFSFSQFEQAVWIPGRLANLTLDNFGIQEGSSKDFVIRSLISDIQNDYRRKWRISTKTLKNLYSYSTSVGIPISADTGVKKPAPVYCDCNLTLRYPFGQMKRNNKEERTINLRYNFSKLTYQGRKAPFSMSIENEDTGTMILTAGQDFGYKLQNPQPFMYTSPPNWGNWFAGLHHLTATIDPTFRLTTILSAILFDDLYVCPEEFADNINVVPNSDFLIIDIPNGTSDIDHHVNFSENPAIFSLEYGWENRETIKEQIEKTIKPQVLATYADNLFGNIEEPTITNKTGILYGTCNSMTYMRTSNVTKTVYVMDTPRQPKINYSNMGSDAQAFLFKSNIFNYKR